MPLNTDLVCNLPKIAEFKHCLSQSPSSQQPQCHLVLNLIIHCRRYSNETLLRMNPLTCQLLLFRSLSNLSTNYRRQLNKTLLRTTCLTCQPFLWHSQWKVSHTADDSWKVPCWKWFAWLVSFSNFIHHKRRLRTMQTSLTRAILRIIHVNCELSLMPRAMSLVCKLSKIVELEPPNIDSSHLWASLMPLTVHLFA